MFAHHIAFITPLSTSPSLLILKIVHCSLQWWLYDGAKQMSLSKTVVRSSLRTTLTRPALLICKYSYIISVSLPFSDICLVLNVSSGIFQQLCTRCGLCVLHWAPGLSIHNWVCPSFDHIIWKVIFRKTYLSVSCLHLFLCRQISCVPFFLTLSLILVVTEAKFLKIFVNESFLFLLTSFHPA